MSSETKYNKDTFIGFLKVKKGGMKIVPGDVDDSIISNRNKIINHLKKVFSGGKSLKEKYIRKYFKALGGKYIRADMLGLHDDKKSSIKNADRLLKLTSKKNLPLIRVLDTFKGSAPSLYKELESKIGGWPPLGDNDTYGKDTPDAFVLEYEYDNAIKKLNKIKSKESLDLVDLEGYSEYTESNSSNTDDEDKEEYEKYGILDESEDDYEEIIEGYDI
jgi:hypothetical protein